jgi:hypothetical protein
MPCASRRKVRIEVHCKAAKQAAKAASIDGISGKRRGRPAKNAQAGETEGQQTEKQHTEQMGLGR